MPVRAIEDPVADAIHADAAAWVGDGTDWYDVHTHIGHHDPDGLEADPEELVAALDGAGQAGALVFPMHEPDGYRDANDTVLAAVREHGGRLDALGRVSPHDPDALGEARRVLDAGAKGIKLHPRSDGFALHHPGVTPVVEEVASRGGVLLVHAGRGIPELGHDAVELARRLPDLRIVLAHAGISDLGLLAGPARELPNLLFDTSWWQVGDLLTLLTTIPPSRVLYASDMPYGPPRLSVGLFVRCAQAAGLAPDVVREIAGPQARRAVAGEPLLDLGPAPGTGGLGPRVLAFERVVAYATGAAMLCFTRGEPAEAVSLARLACQVPTGGAPAEAEVLRACDAYLAVAHERLAAGQDPWAAVNPLMLAQLVAGTGQVGPGPVPAAV